MMWRFADGLWDRIYKVNRNMEAMASAQANTVSQPPVSPAKNANMRNQRDFERARRHSRLVSVSKLLLPLLAGSMVVVFALSVIISYSPVADVKVESAGLRDGKLVMESPTMAGFDKKNRPYDVKAEQAIQDLTNPDIVELIKIDAKLPMDATSFANVDAKSGTYDTKGETLKLHDDIVIKGARGMDIYLKDADIDMKSGSMISNNPVKVLSKDANISADSVKVEDNGKRIVFQNRVKMTITRPVKPANDTSTEATEETQ